MDEVVKKLQQRLHAPEDKLSYEIIGAAIEVHRTLGGPGLMESVYEEAMVYELQSRGLTVARQVEVPIDYKEQRLATPLRVDLLVDCFFFSLPLCPLCNFALNFLGAINE